MTELGLAQVPNPNPLEPYALRIAQVNKQATAEPTIFEKLRVVTPVYEGIRYETELQIGVFKLCLEAIEREVTRQGGPAEYLRRNTPAVG